MPVVVTFLAAVPSLHDVNLPTRQAARLAVSGALEGNADMPEIRVLDSVMYYEDSGSGTALVFLHGNPGSSRLWRKILPRVGPGRLLAPDLIGMGRSGKPDIPYLFADHARYLDAWFDALELDRVVLIGHDWGGALAFDWAARYPARVLGIAFMESIVRPMAWEEFPPQARQRWETIRAPGTGEEMVLDQNRFVREAFTRAVLTPLADEDLEPYLAPYPTRDSRRPILAWARQIPLGGEPADLVSRIQAYDAWLAASLAVPKLLLTFQGSPSLLTGREMTAWCAANIAALEIIACGKAGHHAPEDRPEEIAAAISAWADRHQLR
jgi:haloalkane dehalogenase